jgi:hypothetical protein
MTASASAALVVVAAMACSNKPEAATNACSPLADAAMACSNKPEAATNACSPLADPSMHIVDEGVTEDGHYVVSIGSGDSPSRIFYGTPDHMTEGRITAINAGCFRSYDFVVDGVSYSATFGYPVCMGNVQSKFFAGDAGVEPLTPLLGPAGFPTDAGAPAMGLTFFCF